MVSEHSNIEALKAMAERRGETEYADLLASFENPAKCVNACPEDSLTPYQSLVGRITKALHILGIDHRVV